MHVQDRKNLFLPSPKILPIEHFNFGDVKKRLSIQTVGGIGIPGASLVVASSLVEGVVAAALVAPVGSIILKIVIKIDLRKT